MSDLWSVGELSLSSRLLVGAGKFRSHAVMRAALLASAAEIVTVALRRVDLDRVATNGGDGGGVLDVVPPGMHLLPDTSGAVDADEAVRLARLGRAGTGTSLVKLEVTLDPRTLAPDPIETLREAERLVADGFTVLPYCRADPVLCRHLEDAGCATVMPVRRSTATAGCARATRSRSSSRKLTCRSLWTPGSGCPVTPPRRWRSVRLRCWSTRPLR